MARLPDIPIADWLTDQQERFKEATDGLMPALDFQLGARDLESQIPPDFDAPGGMDQWQEAERQQIEQASREAQQKSEEAQRQQIQDQADQYRQQQLQAEQAQQQEQQAREDAVMQQIQGRGIPTPGDVFAGLTSPGDHSSTTGALDQPTPASGAPVSPLDQFNAHANGLITGMFGGPPTPPDQPPQPPDTGGDHSSTTGLLDRLNPSTLVQQAGEDLGRAASAVTENVQRTVGRVPETVRGLWSDEAPEPTEPTRLLEESGQSILEPVKSTLGAAEGTVESTLGLPPGAAYQATQDVSQVLGPGSGAEILGMIGRGGKEISPASIQAIRDLRANPAISEDIILGLERALAEGSDMALSAVQKLTRAAPEDVSSVNPRGSTPVNPWEPTPEERAQVAAQDAEIAQRPPHSGYLPEDAVNPETATSVSPSEAAPATEFDYSLGGPVARSFTPEEAVQRQLPGFEDVESRPPPRENIRGFGTVPEEPLPGEPFIRAENQAESATRPRYNLAEQTRIASEMLKEDPDVVRPILERALQADPEKTGIEQTLLKQNTQTWGQALQKATDDIEELQQQVQAHLDAGGTLKNIPDDLATEISYRESHLGAVYGELLKAIRGQNRTVAAASRSMNAQRSGYLGAHAMTVAGQLEDIGQSAGRARDALQKVVQDPAATMTDEAMRTLREIRNKLTDKAVKTVGEHEDVAGAVEGMGVVPSRRRYLKPGEGGAPPSGKGPSTAPATPPAPREETLPETLGRLKREQGRLQSMLDDAAPEVDAQVRGIQQSRLDDVQSRIDDVLNQMHEEAQKIAERRVSFAKPDLTPEEAERVVNEAIGRRTQSKIRSEAMAEAKGFRTPEVEATKLTAATEKALRKALDKHVQDTEKLQQSIDAQVQRRVDGMLAQERRAKVRDEVRGMAREAQYWANRIRKEPNAPDRADFEAGLEGALGRMSEHSNVGERVANDLRERLGVNLQEDEYNRAFRESKQQSDRTERNIARFQEDQYQRAFREEKQASDALTASRLRGVQQQLKDVLDNPHGLGRAERISQLYQDLAEISPAGLKKAQSMRRTAFLAGIDKAGLTAKDAAGVNREIAADSLMNMKDPQSMRAELNLMMRPSFGKVWREMRFINMLSNPNTLETNVTSTAANTILKLLIRNPAEFIFSGGHSVGAGAALEGTRGALREGASLLAKTMMTGSNPERFNAALASGRFEHVGQEMLPRKLDPIGIGPLRLGKWLGQAFHAVSTRPLEATDAMMAHMAYSGEYARGARQWIADAKRAEKDLTYLTDKSSTKSVEDQAFQHILDNPWDFPEIQKKAGNISDYLLYRGKGTSVPETLLRRVMASKDYAPDAPLKEKIGGFLVDFMMPFYNVPMNYGKQGTRNIISPVYDTGAGVAAMARGDRTKQGEHFAQATQGLLIMGLGSYLYSGDNLTAAGPTDSGDNKVWRRDHAPYSFRVPGTQNWISYEGSPLAIPLATIAGAGENLEYNKKVDPTMSPAAQVGAYVSGGAQGAIKGLESQTFLRAAEQNFQILTGQLPGVSDLSQAVSSNVSRYFSPVPAGLMRFLAQLADSVERDPGRIHSIDELPQNVIDRLKQSIPGQRETLPEKTGAFGETVPNERSGGMAFVPMYRGPGTGPNDPITQQLERGSIGIPDAPKEIRFSPTTAMPLTIREQQEFQRIYGERYRHLLEAQGAGTRTMSEYNLTRLRDLARQQASDAVRVSIPVEERRRRVVYTPREQVAP